RLCQAAGRLVARLDGELAALSDGAQERGVGGAGVKPREQRVEVRPRLILGRDGATHSDRGGVPFAHSALPVAPCVEGNSFCIMSMTRQSAHILSRSRDPGAANME